MNDWLNLDKKLIWHPFTQHATAADPLVIKKGKGAYLYTDQDQKILDAISSWWVNLHGHCHPHIAEAIAKQVQTLEHVIFADNTHLPAINLAKRLVEILPKGLKKIFFSENGSTSVEVALKICIQYWFNQGKEKRKVIAFRNSYHGDTFGSMSCSERSIFNKPFWPLLFEVLFIDPPLQNSEKSKSLEQLKVHLKENSDIAAFIYEPLVQGAGGMLMQDLQKMNELLSVVHGEGILCIADEVMTGFGRTGKIFASDYLEYKPDLICLSKGITGGFLPLAVTAVSEKIYQEFHSQEKEKAFFHGHSYTANPTACAAACASLDLLESRSCLAQIESISLWHSEFKRQLKLSSYKSLKDIRQRGTILALEFQSSEKSGYFNNIRDKLAKFSLERDVLMRPLGNVLYILPPYCVEKEDLDKAYEVLEGCLETV